MKKVYVYIIALIICLIPVPIAVANYMMSNAAPVSMDTVEQIDIVAPDGSSYSVSKDSDRYDIIGLAVEISENAQKQIMLPDHIIDSPYFTFTFHTRGTKTDYKYYFSEDIESAYYVNSSGIAYHIPAQAAEKFVNTEYSHSIFDNYQPPKACINSTVLNPSVSNWEFKNHKNEYIVSKTYTGENEAVETYGTPAITFDIEPDMLTVKLTDGDNIIYDGMYSSLSNNDISKVVANAEITATWYDDSARNYRGELTYNLDINFKEPPVFYLSSNTAVTGNVLTVSVLNADNLDNINISCEPSLGVDFKFYNGEKYMYALIPISRDVIPGSYVITADYSGQSKTQFQIDVTSDYKESYPYNIEEELFNSVYTDANIKEYSDLFAKLVNKSSSTPLFDGKFISGLPYGTFESADFGTLLTISNNDVSFVSPGKYYTCTNASNIKAVNSGKVIYAAENALAGKMVAVDHGIGVVSIYKHLSSIDVKVGDSVTKDTVLGVSGRSGLMSKKGPTSSVARVEIYVNGIAVDIDPLINSGIVFTD